VAIISVEQLRLYTDNREVFKRFFQPLLVLGVQNQYSWGVAGVKQETAIQAEQYLISTSSPYFPGATYSHLLDFTTTDITTERFERITNEHDRLFSYLYTAVIIKELTSQWRKSGYPIDSNVAVLATLYNIGFTHSKPHANPQSGGAVINLYGSAYSFGQLANEIYNSNELLEFFPR
jgi:hypothetical protein